MNNWIQIYQQNFIKFVKTGTDGRYADRYIDRYSKLHLSVKFCPSVMSDSLQPHAVQLARLPCASPTPSVYSNSCPTSPWCLPTFSYHPLLLLPSTFPSIRVFSSESVLPNRWTKCWSFSFSISPSNAYSGLISFRMDWMDLFVVKGALKSLLQHHSSKASVLQRSAFFIVQLSHPYVTTINHSFD